MGKGKRARVERAEQRENNPELFLSKTNTKKNKKSFPVVTVVFCVVIAFVLAIVAWTVVENTGVINRSKTMAESTNFEINGNEFKVYEFMVTNEIANQCQTEFLYYQYGMMTDTYKIVETYKTAQNYASSMIAAYRNSGTLERQAGAYAKEYLAFCEGAKAANLSLDDDKVTEKVDEYMKSLEESAKNSYTSLSSYISNNIGAGVSKNDIRSAMKKHFLCTQYQDVLRDDFKNKVTSEELDKYLSEHKSDFYTSVYDSYVLMDKDMKAFFETLEGDKIPEDANDLKEIICEYIFNKKFDDLYKTKFTDAKVEDKDKEKTKADILATVKADSKLEGDYKAVFTAKGEGTYNKAAYEIAKSITTDVSTQFKSVSADKSEAYVDPTSSKATAIQKFLFDSKTKAGDVKIDEVTSGSGSNAKTTYTYYIAKEILKLDTECTKDAGYLLLKDDGDTVENKKTAAQKAEAFLTALGSAPTVEKFEEVAAEYTTGSVMYEKISKDGVDEKLGEWLYAEGRKANEVGKVETSGGIYVVIFQETNEMTWKMDVRDAIAAEELNDWYENAVEQYKVVVHVKEETTTTAATTTKAESTTTKASTEAATTAA